MLRNYIRIAWRNITRHKVYTTINVLGLALGICACLIIFLITHYDFSFDTFHPDGNRIYRIVGNAHNDKGEDHFFNTAIPDVAGFQQAIPGFEAKVGFHKYGEQVTIPAEGDRPVRKFSGRVEGSYGPASILTGPDYFSIFTYQWLAGSAAVLNAPFRVVLSEKAARKYFGAGPLDRMIGKTVIYQDSLRVTVGGIVRDWNRNTDLGYTDFISISTAPNSFLRGKIPTTDWNSLLPHGSQVFVKLARGTSPEQVNAAFAAYIKDNVKLSSPASSLTMYLQPLSTIHFTKDFHRGEDEDFFRKPYLPTLYALMGLALFILVIAAVNFINLSTAQSIQRAREIGIRKVMGSRRSGLILQFLTETLLLTALAATLSVLLIRPVLAAFGDFIPSGVKFHPGDPAVCLFLVAITLVTALLAGFYPARVLSSYLPVLSLKGGSLHKGSGKPGLRKALIVFQFTISLLFIIGALVIGNQIRFMRDTDKGFNADAVLSLSNWNDQDGKMKLFAEKAKKITGVEMAIVQSTSPMGFAHMGGTFIYKGKNVTKLDVSMDVANADFIPFYRMKLLAGRNMLRGDSVKEVVINETYARALGFTDLAAAVGTTIYSQDKPHPVVGVVADFFENSFHESMKPVVIVNWPQFEHSVAIRLLTRGKQAADAKPILAALEKQWKSIFPDSPFDYSFLNESITQLYDQETKTAWLMNMAMLITIFISCMGLFGLGLFTAQIRTREIGIRKVLGASVTNITAMLSKDFIVLVWIAVVIASPVAWYFMNRWLQDFAFRIQIGWWVFVVAGLGASGIALMTVSFQAIRAALANPVKSLRSE